MDTDQNGNPVIKDVRREGSVWGANVWWGSGPLGVTTIRRYYYRTREAARNADIGDEPGRGGRCVMPREQSDGRNSRSRRPLYRLLP